MAPATARSPPTHPIQNHRPPAPPPRRPPADPAAARGARGGEGQREARGALATDPPGRGPGGRAADLVGRGRRRARCVAHRAGRDAGGGSGRGHQTSPRRYGAAVTVIPPVRLEVTQTVRGLTLTCSRIATRQPM